MLHSSRVLSLVVLGTFAMVVVPSCSTQNPDGGGDDGGVDAFVEAAPCNPDAGKCSVGTACSKDGDCATLNCVMTACEAATCTDGKQDGNETGVDCGGSCSMCDGATCTADGDCKSGKCPPSTKVCGPSPGKTCGIGLPNACNDGDGCGQDGDCTSDFCRAAKCVVCDMAAHTDGRLDCHETDVDCGGATGAPVCKTGQKCLADADCEGLCDPSAKTCLAPTHTDGKISPSLGEVDVDCGGSQTDGNGVKAKACRSGKHCLVGNDCESHFCQAGSTCEARAAGRQDGDEADVDCGGTADPDTGVVPPRCPDDKKCYGGPDCASTYCNIVHPSVGLAGSEGVCVAGQSCIGTGAATSGIETCGSRETGDLTGVHESCCRSLPLPTMTTVRLDKYEATAGRFRQFINAAGPNLRAWAKNEIAKGTPTGARLQNDMPPVTLQPGAVAGTGVDLLPASADPAEPLNMLAQIGILVMDTETPSMVQGCFNDGDGTMAHPGTAYGANTYYMDLATRQKYLGPKGVARKFTQAQYDEKSMNCATYFMYAAFCAWDGGRMPTPAEVQDAWGPSVYPFKAPNNTTYTFPIDNLHQNQSLYQWEQVVNYFNNDGFYWYHYPDTGPAGQTGWGYPDPSDDAGEIGAPGRFILDKTGNTSANGESWMDLGANLMELTRYVGGGPAKPNFCDWSVVAPGDTPDATHCPDASNQHGGTAGIWRASAIPNAQWVGGSWEGHYQFSTTTQPFFKVSSYQLATHTQYGKTGVRCAR